VNSAATAGKPLIALTGATGFIGQHLLRELPKRGYRLRVLLRRPSIVPMQSASAVVGDLARHRRGPAQQHAQAVAALRQFPQQMLPDEAGGAGERDQHGVRFFVRFRCAIAVGNLQAGPERGRASARHGQSSVCQ